MMRKTCLLVLVVLIASCGSPKSASLTAVKIDGLAAGDDGVRRLETERFAVSLNIPQNINPLAQADIRDYLQPLVDRLVASTAQEPEAGYFETHQYTLMSDWETAESDTLYTFIVRGYSYTGGAHGLPFVATFSYSKADDTRVLLKDLLADDRSLDLISRLAMQHFASSQPAAMANSGLAPIESNWRNWFVSNNRISFLFPPYQVAPYAEGEQTYSLMVDAATRQLFNLDFFQIYEPQTRVTDGQGHGPDPGTQEAARAVAWQLISQSPTYVEQGEDLEIRRISRLQDSPNAWLVDYAWRLRDEPDGVLTGKVRVVDDRPLLHVQ